MKRKSNKQRRFDEELSGMREAVYERAEGRCEVATPMICASTGLMHIHHRRSRRIRKDGKANSLSNLLLVCQPCHALIHHDRPWAKTHGFIVSSNSDPDRVPMSTTNRWMH